MKKVLYFTPECQPFSKVGGIAVVAGQLPQALKEAGIDVSVVTPLYKTVDRKKHGLKPSKSYSVQFESKNRPVKLWKGKLPNQVPVLFLENSEFLDKGPFTNSYIPFIDDTKRFSFFAAAVMPLITPKSALCTVTTG